MSAPSVKCKSKNCGRRFLVFGPNSRPGARVRCIFCHGWVEPESEETEEGVLQ